MRYVEARFDEYQREEAYRFCVTRSLQLIPQGSFMKATYFDIINPKEEDNRTGDEIAEDIIKRAHLKFEE